MCRASGACHLYTPGTQRSRAGLATDAPPALASALAVPARDILTLPSHAQTRDGRKFTESQVGNCGSDQTIRTAPTLQDAGHENWRPTCDFNNDASSRVWGHSPDSLTCFFLIRACGGHAKGVGNALCASGVPRLPVLHQRLLIFCGSFAAYSQRFFHISFERYQ
jgi:hypothetical protein